MHNRNFHIGYYIFENDNNIVEYKDVYIDASDIKEAIKIFKEKYNIPVEDVFIISLRTRVMRSSGSVIDNN